MCVCVDPREVPDVTLLSRPAADTVATEYSHTNTERESDMHTSLAVTGKHCSHGGVEYDATPMLGW